MGSLYCVSDKEEIDRRKKLLDKSVFVDVWRDLYIPNISWLGDDQRMTYSQKRERPPTGLCWMGEASKKALDSVGEPLQRVLFLAEHAVPVYYGPRLTDLESLPSSGAFRSWDRGRVCHRSSLASFSLKAGSCHLHDRVFCKGPGSRRVGSRVKS